MSTLGIRRTLLSIGAISESAISLFAEKTRDAVVPVFRDDETGVIFIDNYYVGSDTYSNGDYRNATCGGGSEEDSRDTLRRMNDFKDAYKDKSIVDIGCGQGSFLRRMNFSARYACGVELQNSFRYELLQDGIPCFENLDQLPDASFDSAFLMHVLEHLPNPLSFLEEVRRKLRNIDDRGRIIIEVPHARDFLIEKLDVQKFVEFTLWSQHLVLHTRDSLRLLLEAAGFKNIQINGVQRYPLSNHLFWLAFGTPGGHKSHISQIDSPEISAAYSHALDLIDCTDTLYAIAELP
jgi:SAM-dependent methyltransferase